MLSFAIVHRALASFVLEAAHSVLESLCRNSFYLLNCIIAYRKLAPKMASKPPRRQFNSNDGCLCYILDTIVLPDWLRRSYFIVQIANDHRTIHHFGACRKG